LCLISHGELLPPGNPLQVLAQGFVLQVGYLPIFTALQLNLADDD
jgi:hypothetical protein